MNAYFTDRLAETDPTVYAAIRGEFERQRDQIELIASENLVSRAVLDAQGSVLTNKTVEGYIGRRYHSGAGYADVLEDLAVERAKQLFGCAWANVQPHSGSQANQIVYLALLKPGDTILSLSLDAGGHLSHGAGPNLSGKWFDAVQYGVDAETGRIDHDAVARLAERHRPKLIIAGGSAYPRVIDFARFRAIADSVGARLLVDMAHFAGLVAGGVHPDPLPHADVVTTTTYKSLRGARGGIVLSNDEDLGKKLNSALFPGLQGSPLLHQIAAKAVCLGECLQPEFAAYARAVRENADALAETLIGRGYRLVSGGTDTALMLVDLRGAGRTGKDAADALEAAGLTCNKNAVPGDPLPPAVTSGLRLSSAAGTTRGFDAAAFRRIGGWIADILDSIGTSEAASGQIAIRSETEALCRNHPIYAA